MSQESAVLPILEVVLVIGLRHALRIRRLLRLRHFSIAEERSERRYELFLWDRVRAELNRKNRGRDEAHPMASGIDPCGGLRDPCCRIHR